MKHFDVVKLMNAKQLDVANVKVKWTALKALIRLYCDNREMSRKAFEKMLTETNFDTLIDEL